MAKLSETFQNTTIYVSSILPRLNSTTNNYKLANNLLKQRCAEKRFKFIDHSEVILDSSKNDVSREMYYDDIHLNDKKGLPKLLINIKTALGLSRPSFRPNSRPMNIQRTYTRVANTSQKPEQQNNVIPQNNRFLAAVPSQSSTTIHEPINQLQAQPINSQRPYTNYMHGYATANPNIGNNNQTFSPMPGQFYNSVLPPVSFNGLTPQQQYQLHQPMWPYPRI